MILRFAQSMEQKAIEYFGTTTDYREAGYVLADGTMLDLSGKNQGGPAGQRVLDHRELGFIVQDEPGTGMDEEEYSGSGWEYVVTFMNLGHIRFAAHSGDSVVVSLIQPTTYAQDRILNAVIQDLIGVAGYVDIFLDVYSEDGHRLTSVTKDQCFYPSCWQTVLEEAGF